MAEVPELRRSILTPARLLIGSLLLGGGIVALGLLFGGGSANAAEHPTPDPLGGIVATVDSVAGGVGQTAGAVVSAVVPDAPAVVSGAPAAAVPVAAAPGAAAPTAAAPTPAAPTPVQSMVVQVVQPVAHVVQHVAATAPVEAVTSPVAQAADQVVAAAAPTSIVPASASGTAGGSAQGAIAPTSPAPASSASASPAPNTQAPDAQAPFPRFSLTRLLSAPLSLVSTVLTGRPVSTLTAPVTATADRLLSAVAGTVVGTVQPLATLSAPDPAAEPSVIAPVGVQPAASSVASATPVAAVVRTAPDLHARDAAPAAPMTAPGSTTLGGTPRGSDLPSPGSPSGVLGTSPTGASAGGYNSGVAALGGGPASLAVSVSARAGLPADDDLPTSPLFDHDISPD